MLTRKPARAVVLLVMVLLATACERCAGARARLGSTSATSGDVEQVVDWRFWRAPDRLVSENLTTRTGEEWQREGATLFHKQLFHADGRGIEFQMDDLRIAGRLPQWTRQALLADPRVLTALTVKRSAWRDGHPLRQYAGAVDGTHWDITLRVDVMLPVTIERRQPRLSERTELIEVHALDAAPWQPTPADAYPLIDYTDLGDMAADPFVQKVQKLTGSAHVH
jgi:hypothetical protein